MWPRRRRKIADDGAHASPDVSDVMAVLHAASAGGALVDAGGKLIAVNNLAKRMELVSEGRFTLAALERLSSEAQRTREIQRITIEVPRATTGTPGGFAPLILEVRAIPLSGGRAMVLAEDRTAARHLDSVRRDFVANISHELKTPVGAIALLAETISDASDDPEAVAEFAGRIRREATRLTSLVQEVIELSRAEAAAALDHPRLVSVDVLIADAVEQSATGAAARDITLAMAPETRATVRGDHDVLVTAVRNLVDNAVNYSPDGSHVAVGARTHNGRVEIAVIDHGTGIDPELQPRIFERFYRIDPARSRETGGSGLGLSIVKHVAAEHGGDVQVWSKPGHGSTFTLRLPQANGEEES
ncbi:MAG TPA: ATP-binding protein [Actinomycetales bacterium]|nr:ATP-binding protein [Actinomycetales bacterium]